jgi:hypothetical protein
MVAVVIRALAEVMPVDTLRVAVDAFVESKFGIDAVVITALVDTFRVAVVRLVSDSFTIERELIVALVRTEFVIV